MVRPRTGETKSRRWSGARYAPKRKHCHCCVDKIKTIDYKDHVKLQPYVSSRGKIEPRRRTGTCAKHQRILATAIKRARQVALLPYVPAHTYKVSGSGI